MLDETTYPHHEIIDQATIRDFPPLETPEKPPSKQTVIADLILRFPSATPEKTIDRANAMNDGNTYTRADYTNAKRRVIKGKKDPRQPATAKTKVTAITKPKVFATDEMMAAKQLIRSCQGDTAHARHVLDFVEELSK